jgi:hypothetical protein
LFGVVQDATANPKARAKAALKIAEFLLPKAAKKPKVIPDEHGFSISPNLASAYREIQRELRALMSGPARKIRLASPAWLRHPNDCRPRKRYV